MAHRIGQSRSKDTGPIFQTQYMVFVYMLCGGSVGETKVLQSHRFWAENPVWAISFSQYITQTLPKIYLFQEKKRTFDPIFL